MKHFSLQAKASLKEVFPSLNFNKIITPNMSVGSDFFGEDVNHENLIEAQNRLDRLQQEHPNALLANGYLESRSFYNTPNYERISSTGLEYRNVHLGTDFWIQARTPVHAPFNGRIVIAHDNAVHKDYGPLIVLAHEEEGQPFYTLYGHLTRDSLEVSSMGKVVSKGEHIGWIGTPIENGHWAPHLHFQVITDLLGHSENYPGVAYPSELEIWKVLCPDPDLVFSEHLPNALSY